MWNRPRQLIRSKEKQTLRLSISRYYQAVFDPINSRSAVRTLNPTGENLEHTGGGGRERYTFSRPPGVKLPTTSWGRCKVVNKKYYLVQEINTWGHKFAPWFGAGPRRGCFCWRFRPLLLGSLYLLPHGLFFLLLREPLLSLPASQNLWDFKNEQQMTDKRLRVSGRTRATKNKTR